MAADDVCRIAEKIGKRIERLRQDGGDPRDASALNHRFAGFGYPPDKPRPGSGWISPISISIEQGNYKAVDFNFFLGFTRDNLEEVITQSIYTLMDPGNPFGVFRTLERYTYAGLEQELGGSPFADTESDALDLGPSSYPTHSGKRLVNIDIKSADVGDVEYGGGTLGVYFESQITVKIPPD